VDDRAAAPVVGKALEIAVLVVFVGLVSASLFGSVVPAYRTAAGAEVGDRVLTAAAGQIETAANAPPDVVERRVTISLPRTVRGTSYEIQVEDESGTLVLVLDHPNAAIGGRTALAVPPRVTTMRGELRSAADPAPVAVVTGRANGTVVVTLR
jgi:hypothetical protein